MPSRSEGFETGGHNGREEHYGTPDTAYVTVTSLPLIAAGRHAAGAGRSAITCFGGADGVQVGTRFALTEEKLSQQKCLKNIACI